MAPVLFNLAFEQVVRNIKDNRSIELLGNRTLLAYANDIVILGEFQDQIISSTLKLIEAGQRIGLKINKDKKKYLVMFRRTINKQNIDIDQYPFEQVNNYKYLRVNIR